MDLEEYDSGDISGLATLLEEKDRLRVLLEARDGSQVSGLPDRAVNQLLNRCILVEEGGEVSLTEKGELLVPLVEEFLEKSYLVGIQPFLEAVDDLEELPPLELLKGADFEVEGSEEYKRDVVDAYNEYVEESSTLKELSPFILGAGKESGEAVTRGSDALYVFSDEMMEDVDKSEYFQERLDEYLENQGIDVLRYEGSFPFMLTVLDDRVLLIAKGEGGRKILCESESEELVEWGAEKVERYVEESTPLRQE